MSDAPYNFNEILHQQLLSGHALDQQITAENTSGPILDIPQTGKIVSSAYEQLRNAAEYSEDHLLLQRAIKRFLKRSLFVSTRSQRGLGTELIIDLTQSGYLHFNQFSESTAKTLDKLIEQYMTTHGQLLKAKITGDVASNWILALLSTEIENRLNPHNIQQATLVLAYQYFLGAIPKDQLLDLPESDSFEFCLYIAVQQAILKADIDVIRYDIHRLYGPQIQDTTSFIYFSTQVDKLFSCQLTQTLKRTVSRYGAPFRVLKNMIDDHADTASLLPHKADFLDAYDQQINHEYKYLRKRLTRGLVKGIIFILITKVLIGLIAEIPYDLFLYGRIIRLPLAVNLLFPPLYMASLMLTLEVPSASNKHGIHSYMEQLLYGEAPHEVRLPKRRKTTARATLGYTILFLIPIAVTVVVLRAIGFNVLQMVIFFIFFSTASFLGFRLSTLVRDLELTPRQTGLLASLQDFFYLPFVTTGQWLSRKYTKLNVIASFMDIAIELPLKSLLRILRQWISFIREKRDELY